jgi:filamentous hemagglutinin
MSGKIASVEVKNYNVATNTNALINNASAQAIERETHLPEGIEQRIVIDIRGQDVSIEQKENIVEGIVIRSNGIITAQSIRFRE